MKKKLLLCIFLLFNVMCYSQEKTFPKNANNEYEFSEVVEIGLSKQTLFANALSWAMSFYEDYKSVVQTESESDGRLVIKDYELILYPQKTEERVYYTLTIDCKDNKYRYVFNDIKIKDYTPDKYSIVLGISMGWDVNHEQHLEKIKELSEERSNIEKQMQNASATLKGGKLKKTTKKLQALLDDINDNLAKEEFLYNDEFNTFDRLINSLKKKMSENTDF